MEGMRGDTLLVNGVVGPTARVPRGLVRLRLLNAANARNFDVAFADGRPFMAIAGDAGLLPAPVELTNLVVAPGERYEILADFANGAVVDLITGPDRAGGMGMPAMGGGSAAGGLVRFEPDAQLPAAIRKPPSSLAPNAAPDRGSAATARRFVLDPTMGPGMMFGAPSRSNTSSELPQRLSINGRGFAMDRIDAAVKLGTSELWEVTATDMAHPFHVHGVSFRVLSNGGAAPPPQQSGWKDVVLVQQRAELLIPFTQPAGPDAPFMFHCHILEHEDQGMMGQFAVA